MTEIIDLRKKPANKEAAPQQEAPVQKILGKPKQESESPDKKIIWETADQRLMFNKSSAKITAIILLIIAGGLIYFGQDKSFATLIGLFGLIVILNIYKTPKKIMVMIDRRGIYIDDTFYPYREFESYWLEYQISEKSLSFTPKKWYLPRIKVPIGQKSPFDIKDILNNNLDEKRIEKNIIDTLMSKIGF
jgi:hypothetical protein